jgi:uncharacterized protein (DUF2141 family)
MHVRLLAAPILIALSLAIAPQQASAQAPISVTVTGIEDARGTLRVGLYSDDWESGPITGVNAPASSARVTVTLQAPRPGRYAVRLYQDKNDDNRLATGAFGMPTEPYGTSNNAPSRFGPPSFADAAFDVTAAGAAQTIALR